MNEVIQLPLTLPPALAEKVAALTRPPNPAFNGFPPPEPEYDPAAAEWLDRKRKLLAPGVRDQCEAWFAFLLQGINNVTEEQSKRTENAIWLMCSDLPCVVWCTDTLKAVWSHTPFLPGPGECHAVLSAYVAPLLAEIAALERIVAARRFREVRLPPYEPPPAPEWVTSQAAGRKPLHDPHPPIRTIEEQIAALKAGTKTDPAAD